MDTARPLPTSSSSPAPAIPRLAASLVVVNAQNEILLVHRNLNSRSFAGVHVFPGGNFDDHQDMSMEMTAIRETFEETGLLLASSPRPTPALTESVLDEARDAIISHKLSFTTFLAQHDLTPDTDSLLPFTQWITPPPVPRRYHTRFFVTFLPPAHAHRAPTPDSAQEVVAARFAHPLDVLAAFHARALALMPPQFYLVSALAACLETRVASARERARVERLARGAFGAMVINPRALPRLDPEGRTVLTYEGDETRGGRPGRLHRSLVRFGKGGIPTEVTLLRNFDIFTEIETHLFSSSSKL